VIIGSGLLARAFSLRFRDDPEVIVFASGVSNSLETRITEFQRERDLLRTALAASASRLVYFGSCAVGNLAEPPSPYLAHKRAMEEMVLESGHGLVFRLPQVVGRTDNPSTLGNFIYDCISTGRPFTVWRNAERNLIDVEDVARISQVLMERSIREPVSIAAPASIGMPDLVAIFERVLGREANISMVEKGTRMIIDTRVANQVARELSIDLGNEYTEKVVRKYYGSPR
jgi:nucleoside-diphosphate-sugar epimerase